MSQSALEELRGLLEKGSELQTKDPALKALLKLNLTPDSEMVKNVHVRAYIIMQEDSIFKEDKLKGVKTAEGFNLYPLKNFRGFAYEAASLVEADNKLRDAAQQEREIFQAFDHAKVNLIKTVAYPLRNTKEKKIKQVSKGLVTIFHKLDRIREKIRIESPKRTQLKEKLFLLLQGQLPNDTPDLQTDMAILSILKLFGIDIKPRTALKAIQRKVKK